MEIPGRIPQKKGGIQLPPLISRVAELTLEELGSALATMMDAVDDYFFSLAEQAGNNADQNFYFEAMRDIRIGRRGVEQAFKQNIENGFRSMCFSVDLENPDDIELPVLKNGGSEEINIAVGKIESKFKVRHGAILYQTTVRLDTISDTFTVTEISNALSPMNLCNDFDRASQLLSLDDKSRVVLLSLFDRHVIKALPMLLEKANLELTQAGILPEFEQQLSESANECANAKADKQDQVFSQLQTLLASDVEACTDSERTQQQNHSKALSHDELIDILSSLQRNTPLPTKLDAQIYTIDVRQQVRALAQQRDEQYKDCALSREDKDVIILVEKLFSAIRDDVDLSDFVKASLSRLQIPLVKLGLLDRGLFAEREHVGRKLLNELATLGASDKEKSEMARNVLYTKIEEIAQRIVREFDEDTTVFEKEYNNLMLFHQRTQSRAMEMEQRTRMAEAGQERVELARVVIAQNIDLLMKDQFIPAVVEKLLYGEWANVMLLALLKESALGESWADALLTAEELIWSVQPEKDRAARQRLLQLIPHLLEKISKGLATINFEPFLLSEMLSELEQVHLSVFGMNKLPIKRTSTKVDVEVCLPNSDVRSPALMEATGHRAVISNDIADITRQVTEKSDCSAESLPSGMLNSEERADSYHEGVESQSFVLPEGPEKEQLEKHEIEVLMDQISLGVWFEVFNKEAEGKYRCKLAAHLTGFNKYIFVNRRGEKVMERSRTSLVEALASGEMKIIKETQLFDRALQSVVNDLRMSKGVRN